LITYRLIFAVNK